MAVKDLRETGMIALAAALPLAGLYFARSVYRYTPDLYAQSGFMIGLGIAFFALCVLYNGIGTLRLDKRFLLANLSLILAAVVLRAKIPVHGPILHPEWIGLLWTLIIGTGLVVFVEPKRLLAHFRANVPIFYFAGAVYMAQVLYYMLRHVRWFNKEVWYGTLAGEVAGTVRFLLELMGYELLPVKGANVIKYADFRIWINAACSGLEGVVFFVAVFSCMMMLDYKSIPIKKIVYGYLAGIVLMLTLNIMRITMFFMFGVWVTQNQGPLAGTKLTLDLFHNNIGWILYMIGMVAFFVFFYKSVDKKKEAG